MQITQLHKSLSQLTWDDVVSKILLMRNRRRVSPVPVKQTKVTKGKTKVSNKKQPKQLDLFACANTMTQGQKDLLFQELSKLMEIE